MLAVFDQIKEGKIKYTSEISDLITSSITYQKGIEQGNADASKLIDLLGGPQSVDRILKQKYPYFKQTNLVENIPKNGKVYKNTTSSNDLDKFYNQLWLGKDGAFREYSEEMKRVLSLPKGDRLFHRTCIPEGTSVYNKTGTLNGLVADSGILIMKDNEGKSHPYAITVLIEDRKRPGTDGYRGWARNRAKEIRAISEGVYGFLYKLHTNQDYVCKRHNGHHLGNRQ